jgi:hypothetical protein
LSLVVAVDVTTGDMVLGGECGMERRFRVEAKTFFFSTKASQLRLEERRKGFLGLILVDLRRAAWLAGTVEEASRSPALADFDKISSEGRRSLSVRGGSNKGGRFLEVVASVDDERKGIIWIPEARSGRGWRRFTTELRSLLAALESVPGFSAEDSSAEGKVERSPGITYGRSYADAVRSSAGEEDVGLQLRSSQEVDLFPVASSFELGNDGSEASSAWVCFEVETANLPSYAEVFQPESSLKRYFSTAAADEEKGKMMKEGILVIRWLWKLLGLGKEDLGRVMDGLQVKPSECTGLVKLLDSGLEFGLVEACGLDSGMMLGPKPGSVDGPDPGLVSGSVYSPDPGPSVILSPVWGPVSSGQGSVVSSGTGSAAGDGSAAGNGAGSVFGDSSAAGDGSRSAPGAAAVGVVDGSEITSPVPFPMPVGLPFPAKTALSVDDSNSGKVDELSRPSEEAGSRSMVSGFSKVFDGQRLRSEESGSSPTVTGPLLVSSSRLDSDVTVDDGSSTVVPAEDGSSTAPVGSALSNGPAWSTGSEGLDPAGDETGSFYFGSVESGRACAGDGSESYSSDCGSVSTAANDGSDSLHDRELWSVCIAGGGPVSAPPAGFVYVPDGNESAMPAGSRRLLDSKHLSFGLAKSQIWLLGWIEDRLKINEDVKDKDHSAFLKAMEEDFRWINLVAREQGRLVVDEEDIRSLSIVACEGGWKVDEEEDARKVAWLTEMKDKLSLSITWSGSMGMMDSV